MCGIAGVVSVDASPLPREPIAEAMCALIAHRGPDDQGIYRDATAQIGMRRLAIIDLASGHQPIHNEDSTVWIVFNGEIYNFKELRAELERAGHSFYTNTDTECIVHAYEEYGEACFAKLRGMFAIAILDLPRRRLVLARDRLGKKPLYYTEVAPGMLAFASELKCMGAVPGFRPTVSNAATREYFALGYVPGPGSIYEEVRKLEPGHYLVLEDGRIRTQRYWSLAFGPKWGGSEDELEERLLAQLDDAVRVRLVSDVPFGAFLSGGLDSSIVTALMARHMSSPVRTFTIGFEEDEFNEAPDARRVAAHIGAQHEELVMRPDAVDLVQKIAWHCDEPFGDASSVPTYLVAQLAASRVKMVLSGDGGDEAFAGYERYGKYQRLNRMARLSAGMLAPALKVAGALAGGARGIRLSRIGERARLPYPERYISGVALSTAADLSPLLSKDIVAIDPYAHIRGHFMRDDIAEPMERVLSGDMATYLVDDVLVKVDRMTMANSLEARAPLLDHLLLEFCARLPYRLKHDGTTGKYLLRKVARRLLPPECLAKGKRGFGVPLARWFRGELKPLMQDLLADSRFRERGVFDVAGVRACFRAHQEGLQDFSELLWLVLTYEMWARTFADRSPSGGSPVRQ
jgi:asparagine synthase (glutamine-hydrolysing)